jgi:ribosomal protein S18 acetylase RimI-like enzyme
MENAPRHIMKINHALTWSKVSNPGSAAELIRLSWSENHETSLNYDEQFFRSCFEYPGTGPIIAPALSHGNKLIAFVLGMPRTVLLNGQHRKLILMTLFTVAPEWKGHRLGVAVWAECLRQAREAGYDGSIHFCVEGNISNHVTQAGAREAGLEARHVLTVQYLMHLLRSIPSCEEPPQKPSSEDFAAAADSVLPVPLARRWTPAEAEWQCRGRVDPICVTYRNGECCAALAGYRMRSLDSPRTVYSFIDDIHWDQLTGSERTRLLRLFLRRAAESAQVAVVPLLGYADMSPFLDAGFRRSTRVLNTYLTMWNGNVEREMPGLYMDVL